MLKQRNIELLKDYALIAPALLILVALVIYPILSGIYLSFFDYNLLRETQPYVGIDNYIVLLSDPRFLKILWNTVLFAVLANAFSTLLGLASALLLNSSGRFVGLLRALGYLPWITPAVVFVIIWSWMFSGSFSPINAVLMQWGIIKSPISFLGDEKMIFLGLSLPVWSMLVVRIWASYAFKMTMFLAALQNIPQDRIDAARVDGANSWHVFRYVTMPGIMPVLLIVVSLSMIWNLSHFEVNYLLTAGGPKDLTNVITVYLYQLAFVQWKFGHAAAAGIYTLLLASVAAIVYLRLTRSEER